MLPVASTYEELDLGEERLKVWDVWHGELHKSGGEQQEVSKNPFGVTRRLLCMSLNGACGMKMT